MCSWVTVSSASDRSVSESEVRKAVMSSRVRASLRGPREGSVMAAPSRYVGGGAFLTDDVNARQSINTSQVWIVEGGATAPLCEGVRMRVALMVTCINDAMFPDAGK